VLVGSFESVWPGNASVGRKGTGPSDWVRVGSGGTLSGVTPLPVEEDKRLCACPSRDMPEEMARATFSLVDGGGTARASGCVGDRLGDAGKAGD
jgi:hypothetical protein